jgi:hypothetical protein
LSYDHVVGKDNACEGREFGSSNLITVICGFATIVAGVFLLHVSRDAEEAKAKDRSASLEQQLLDVVSNSGNRV